MKMHMALQNKPLVSIIVITYNSSEFVSDTLESAKNQSYQNIELVITDDCSTDNTVAICKNWIDKNKHRFVRTEVVTSAINTGISPNCNRGYHAARGEWLKLIAGDDILLDTCIEDFMDYYKKHRDCQILFGQMYYLKNDIIFTKASKKIAVVKQKKQKRLVYMGSGLPSPAAFFKKEILKKFGGFDENYSFIEDLPFWIKLVNEDIQLHFIQKFVVIYRIHENNTCMNNNNNFYLNKQFYFDNERIITRKLLSFYFKKLYIGHLLHSINYIIINRLIISLGNKNNLISRMLSLFIIKTTLQKSFSWIKYSIQIKFHYSFLNNARITDSQNSNKLKMII